MTTKPIYNQPFFWAALASTPLSAWADVDLLTGGFSQQLLDPLGPLPSKIRHRRSYQSRSLYNGAFGFGWCSEFEKNLILKSANELLLNDCQTNHSLIFSMMANGEYKSSSGNGDKIVKVNGVYRRFQNQHHTESFNTNGQLIEVIRPEGTLLFEYSGSGKIHRIRLARKDVAIWQWDSENRKVLSIENMSGPTIRFKYQDDNLVQASDLLDQKLESYRYDDAHNLIENNDQFITYDKDRDLVTEFLSNNGCLEKFRYASPRALEQTTEHTKTCGSKLTDTEKIRFLFRSNSKNQVVISRVELTKNKRTVVYSVDKSGNSISANSSERRQRIGALHE